jgi:hypothetical protein
MVERGVQPAVCGAVVVEGFLHIGRIIFLWLNILVGNGAGAGWVGERAGLGEIRM